MKDNARFRWGINFIVLFILTEIDNGCCLSPKVKDGSKGQPELLQPLDNHPRTPDENGANLSVSSDEAYQQLLAQKANNLLSEAIGMLGRAKDAGSRHWLELFIYKMSELTLELEGKSDEDQKMDFSSAMQPPNLPTPTPFPETSSPAKHNQLLPKDEVTPVQLSGVLPANEGSLYKQAVTLPGFSANATEVVEDEVVRQLHDQTRKASHAMEVQRKKSDQYPARNRHTATQSPLNLNDIDTSSLNENEKELLMQLVQDFNSLQDVEDIDSAMSGKIDDHNVVDFTDPKFLHYQKSDPREEENEFEVVEDRPIDESNEYNIYGEDDALAFNFYFPSTPEPEQKEASIKSQTHLKNVNIHYPFNIEYQQGKNRGNTVQIPKVQNSEYKQWLPPYALPQNFQSHPKFKQDVQNIIPQNNITAAYTGSENHPVNNDSDKKKRVKQARISMSSPNNKPKATHDYNSEEIQHHSEKSHPDYSHQDLLLNYKQTLKNNRPFQENGKIPTVDTALATQITSPVHYPHHVLSLTGDLRRLPSEYTNSNYNSQLESPIKGSLKHNSPLDMMQQHGFQRVNDRHKFKPKSSLSHSTNELHTEELSIPHHFGSNRKLQENMERQLRAGKVVILSDSLVRMNSNKKHAAVGNPKQGEKIDIPENNKVIVHNMHAEKA